MKSLFILCLLFVINSSIFSTATVEKYEFDIQGSISEYHEEGTRVTIQKKDGTVKTIENGKFTADYDENYPAYSDYEGRVHRKNNGDQTYQFKARYNFENETDVNDNYKVDHNTGEMHQTRVSKFPDTPANVIKNRP